MSETQARLHRIPAVQEILGVSRATVFRLMSRGELRSVKIGTARRIPESAIAEYLDRIGAAA